MTNRAAVGKASSRSVLLVAALLGIGLAPPVGTGPAHAAARLVEESMMCPVVGVSADKDKNLLVRIARGSEHGIVKGAIGDLFGPGENSGVGEVVARAEVIEVRPQESVARLFSGSVTDPTKVVEKAQLELRALVPSDVHRGTLFRLYMNGIEFLDNMKLPLVSGADLLAAKDDAVEKATLAKMVVAGREVAEFTYELPQIQTRTRWKGKTVPEILEHNDEYDYLEFLRFVLDFPGKYIGKPWKISETYATWLVNFSPPAHIDRHAELRDTQGKTRDDLAKALTDDQFKDLIGWARKQIDGLPVSRSDEGFATIKVLEQILKARGGLAKTSSLIKAELAHVRARALHNQTKRVAEAVKAYREASAAYLTVGTDEATIEGIICLNNAQALLATSGSDDEALALLATIKQTIAERQASVKSPMYKVHVSAAEVFPSIFGAQVLQRRGQYREVIDLLTPLLARYGATGSKGARAREMELMEAIAKAHVKLGELAEAEALHDKVSTLASELGDVERTAAVAYSVGDMYYTRARYEEAAKHYARSAAVAEQAGLGAARAKALGAEAQALWSMGRLPDALSRHEAAMGLREALGDKSGIAWQSVQVGKIQVESGDREAAKKAFERALSLYTELDAQGSQAEVRIELGQLHLSLQRAEAAEAEFALARDIYKLLKWRVLEANAVQRMATARFKRGDEAAAEKLVVACIALLEKTGDKQELIAAKLWLARIQADDTKRRKGARAMFEQLMPKDRTAEPGLAIDVLLALSTLDLSEGMPEPALVRANEALALAEKNQDVNGIIRGLTGLRYVYGNQGDLVRQEEVMTRVLALARQSGNRPSMVEALQQLAWVQTDTGRLSEAKKNAEESLALARQNDDPYAVAWALNTLSRVYQSYNDVRKELELLDEALRLMTEAHFRYGKAAILFNRSLTYARLRDLERALEGYRLAEAAGGSALDAQFEVALPSARGEALALLGRSAEAEKELLLALTRARTKNPGRVPGLLGVLARFESDRGRHAEALRYAEEALKLEESRKGSAHGAYAVLGRILSAAGRFDEARAALEKSVTIARATGGAANWEALHQLALLESKRGERKAAIVLLEEAAREIEKSEVVLSDDSNARQHGDKVEVFRLLVKLLLADGRVDAGFQYLERSKAAELRDLDRRLGGGNDPNASLAFELEVQEKRLQRMLDEEYAKVEPNRSKIKQLDDLLSAVRIRRARFIESVDRNNKDFDKYAIRPSHLGEMELSDGVLFIAPIALDDSVVVFVLTKDVLTHFTTSISADEVDKLVVAFVREVDPKGAVGVKSKASLARLKPQAQRLYDLFLRPAIDAVGMPRTLILSPTGSLRYLPFSALHDGEKWLVERTSLLNVTALDREKLAQVAPRNGSELTVMAFLDPTRSLSNAHLELAEVKKAFERIDIFEGKDATSMLLREKVRVPGYDILHLATHGLLDAKNPEMSHLALADKPFTYDDIGGLVHLKTQLVVLSACQTAVLSGGSGVEIAGLAHKFMQQKVVRSVMATLWKVDDRATAELMAHFYHELRAGKRYIDALADAQKRLIAQPATEHPGYWAPFVLMGNWK